ncbi:hotdog domain-containing protein [Fusibacter bizertensis]|uniref:Hotdog domain-containing protein n=1 Tax=Fusibacter bizertensis TaxID=1488331 RepID=A0ABT6NCT1_9FIRM|nr:hotdog domain-containing protein [Fusibacter bizertensis]MDH8678226.1 hotdog domain-containing protein [Fusibacter bizertensis]
MNQNNISFSRAETCMVMEPIHSNIFGNVHGGELMKLMDVVAGITASKHAKGMVVTARVDELEFHKSIGIGAIVTCVGQLSYVGKSSMQVMVTVSVHEVENYSEPEVALTAFFTMVHIKDHKPHPVQPLNPETEDEKKLYALGEQKYIEIKAKMSKKI